MSRRGNERAITAALVLSVLVHLAAFFRIPQIHLSMSDLKRQGTMLDELSVQLVPRPRPPRAPPMIAQSRPAPAPRPPRAAPPQRPPVLALKERSASAPPMARPAPAVPRAAPAPTPQAGDLTSYIEARRRARADTPPSESVPSAPSREDPNARANRLAAANISAGRAQTFGYDPRRSGGIFSVTKQTYDYAEFMFFGWNQEMSRNTAQLITVEKGNAPDIRIAVVRRMIAIVRHYEQGDFVWESQRLGRNVTLSARLRDTAGLEDFLLREFFPEWTRSTSGQG